MSYTNDDLFAWDNDPIVVPLEIEPKAPYARCHECPLAAMPCVPSYTPAGAPQLILVGEAPGQQEVRQGEPFVGASGQLLNAVLEHIGIDPASCYKTNAVLCRPPNNDLNKYAEAVVACQERLRHELAAIPTSDVVALGAAAVASLSAFSGQVDKRGILTRHGQRYALENGKTFLAAYHPAFVLRSTGYMAQFMQDLRSLTLDRSKDWLAIEPIILTTSNLSNWVQWLSERIGAQEPIAFDIETPNLESSQILALGMTSGYDGAWIIPPNMLTSAVVKELLNRAGDRAHWVAHNGKFDQEVLVNNGIRITLAGDTMLQHYALDEIKGTHGLKNLAASFLGVPDYEAQLVDKYFKADKRESRDYSKIPTDDLYKYLAIDCCATLALYHLFATMIELDNVQGAYQIAIDASETLLQTKLNGIKIDRPYLELVHHVLNNEIGEAYSDVQYSAAEYVLPYLNNLRANPDQWRNPDPSWIKGTKGRTPFEQYCSVLVKCLNISLGSWQQMQVLLYDVLKLKHIKKLSHKTKPRSTCEEALDALEDHPFVRILQEFRRLDKIRGTYVVKLLELADRNDRVHINFNLHGTETGRLSANDGLHGIPRPSDQWGRAIRGSFIADQGKKLILADYAQAELRIFAAESGEPFLLDIFNNGRDPHGETCKMLFAGDPLVDNMQFNTTTQDWDYTLEHQNGDIQIVKDYWKERRTTAKNVVFGGLVYLGGASGIAAMLGGKATAQQIQPVLVRLLAQMPTARKWQLEQLRKARKDGFVQSRFGNKRRFLLITDDNLDEIKKASVNAPIQNSASQLTLLSAIELHRKGIKVLHLNHDQIICEASDDLADRTAQIVEQTMVGMGIKWFPEVKWAVDVETDRSWYPFAKRPTFEDNQNDNN